ncbi:MAG: cell division protein FtsQ/DivIB [Balneolaceae bacterium]
MKKQSKKDRGAGLSWIIGALILLVAAIMAGIYWKDHAEIREVRFIGHHYTTGDELTNAIPSPVGMHPDSLHFGELIDPVVRLPWVKRADIRLEANGRMILRITERDPIAMMVRGEKRAYTDRDGLILPVVPENPGDLPILYGFPVTPAGDTLDSDAFRIVRDFLIAARNNEFGWTTISEVTWNEREGVVALSHENGVKLIFGDGEFDKKFRTWEVFYAEVIRTKGIQFFESVDLRFSNQIVAREL